MKKTLGRIAVGMLLIWVLVATITPISAEADTVVEELASDMDDIVQKVANSDDTKRVASIVLIIMLLPTVVAASTKK